MKIMDKIWGTLGIIETVDEEESSPKPEKTPRRERAEKADAAIGSSDRRKAPIIAEGSDKKAVVAISDKTAALIVFHPSSFDDARRIAECVKNKRPVIVNFEKTDDETMSRTVDFMSGITYAVDGTVQRVSASIFLFAPSNVDVSAIEPLGSFDVSKVPSSKY